MVDERQIGYAFDYVNKNLSQYICPISDTKFNESRVYSEPELDKFIIQTLNEKEELFGFDFEEK